MGSHQAMCVTVFLLFLVISLYHVEGRLGIPSLEENLEFDRELTSLNKHGVKTIKTVYGDIYNCVDLYKQPALDHPSLKNHKIQMKPSFTQQKDQTYSVKTGLVEECPWGTVPIRRISKQELLRAKTNFIHHFQTSVSVNAQPPPLVFSGITTVPRQGTVYHAAAANINICNPEPTGFEQLSASTISIEGSSPDSFSVIRVGWMVNPSLYHDNHIRLYTIWGQLSSRAQIGCYNTYCPGFVQTNPSIPLDMVLEPVSVIRGPQYYVKLMVSQDKETGNWWLTYSESDMPVGYWPSSLFANLKDGAQVLGWGGMVSTNTPQLPPMGNGDNGEIHSCHFRQVALKYESGTSLNVTMDVPLTVIGNKCYRTGGNSYKYDYWGYSFYFGGNGGETKKCSHRSTFH
ncbi:hypothetical protein ACOSQ2_009893 [Xanthoceras sorbifolium]